ATRAESPRDDGRRPPRSSLSAAARLEPAREHPPDLTPPDVCRIRAMKIALLGPVAWRTPPRHYGPWEQVTSLIAEGLVARGVDVTLFATLNSMAAATLDGVCATGYAESPGMDGRIWEALHVAHALKRSGEFDLIHNHTD